MPRQLKGGVGVKDDAAVGHFKDLNSLQGDIVSFQADDGEYNVKLRGTNRVVTLPRKDLVELRKLSETFTAMEGFRDALLEVAAKKKQDNYEEEWLLQLVQAMELSDQFSYLVSYHTNPVGFHPLPDTVQKQALVRYMEAYIGGHGVVATGGRQLTSFHMALAPFYCHKGGGHFERFSIQTSGDVIAWCQEEFTNSIRAGDASIIVRAFAFVEHRKDYCDPTDSLLDALCVAFSAIQFLQGGMAVQITDYIEEEFRRYGTLGFTLDDVLWCFCRSFLTVGIVVRDKLDKRGYNVLLPEPYGTTVSEQKKIGRLMIQLRPDDPSSYLSAYITLMDIIEFEVCAEHMQHAYEMMVAGIETADRFGDPLFQYLFHTIAAFWMPTTAHGAPVTVGEVKARLLRADEFKKLCASYTPAFCFFEGKQYKGQVLAYVETFGAGDFEEFILPPMDPYAYCSVRFGNAKYYKQGGKFDRLGQRFRCDNCSKQMLLSGYKCGRCGNGAYCGKDCQKEHWKSSHKAVCKERKKK
mmetsp:Transcript_11535/g.16926  ORF Transcript_11535/g.16926 Transcript_11535/m.16926 type:complete len:523 (-) Transcript_11535:660-2228(-)